MRPLWRLRLLLGSGSLLLALAASCASWTEQDVAARGVDEDSEATPARDPADGNAEPANSDSEPPMPGSKLPETQTEPPGEEKPKPSVAEPSLDPNETLCGAKLAATTSSKQGEIHRASLESGELIQLKIPPCFSGLKLVTALAVEPDGAIWMAADGALFHIEADRSKCTDRGKLQANALAFVPAHQSEPDRLYALSGEELSAIDPESSQRKPFHKVRAHALAGTADGKLLTFENTEGVLLMQLLDPVTLAMRPLYKAPAPKAYFAGGAYASSRLWFVFGDTRYYFDEKEMTLVAAGPLASPAGTYLFTSPACEVFTRPNELIPP